MSRCSFYLSEAIGHLHTSQIRVAIFLVWLATGTFVSALAADDPTNQPPNIVWIWADNLAYADLGVYGNRRVKTPVLDRLASDGVRFTQYYVAHAVCSPSRAALLTGRQPFRAGIVDVLRPDGPSGLPDDEFTLAEALGQQGYTCGAIGKWHLGDRIQFLPRQHGFDHYFGLPYSMDMLPTILYRDNEIIDRLEGDKVDNVTERLTDAAIDFIAENRQRPFFLYFSHSIPHPPLNLPAARRTPDRSLYENVIEYLDSEVGRLLAALDRYKLTRDTLVIFTSDNGPMLRDGDTGGLRGRIRDSYEGGLRVPLIARWPGKISPAMVENRPAIAYDIFPTLIQLAGGALPEDRTYDGQDIWPLFTGKGDFQRTEPFVWVYFDKVTAVRDGRWKLHVAHRNQPLNPSELYDLDTDPQEAHSVHDKHREVVTRLEDFVARYQSQIPKVWSLQYPVRDPAKRPSGVRRK